MKSYKLRNNTNWSSKLFPLLLLVFINSCHENSSKNTSSSNAFSFKNEKKDVEVLVLGELKNDFNQQIVSNGKIESKRNSKLHFKRNDIITSINFSNGQSITKGNVIATLETDLLNNQLDRSKIEYQKAKNRFEEEKINYGSSNLSEKILDKLKVKSGLLEAQNNLDKAHLELEQTILKAPFSGVIANIEKKQGDYITSSDIFCTLIDPVSLEVSFSILENEFDFISKGQEIFVQSFSNRDQKFYGEIIEINPIVDKNGLIKIKAKVLSTNKLLLDGMHVRVFINKPIKEIIEIPKKSLVLRSNKEVVFTYTNGLAKWNYVEIAGENNSSYAVNKGLKQGDTIIISGNANLAHDTTVNITSISKVDSKNN